MSTFVLHVIDGYPWRTVAAMEGVPVAEIRCRVALARAFLRARLAEEYNARDSANLPPGDRLFMALKQTPTAEARDERLLNRLRSRQTDARPHDTGQEERS